MKSSMASEQVYRRISTGTESANPPTYSSLRKTARLAGLLYFVGGMMSAFAIMYVPSKVLVEGNASATFNNILAHELLFRMGIAGMLASSVISVFLLLLL